MSCTPEAADRPLFRVAVRLAGTALAVLGVLASAAASAQSGSSTRTVIVPFAGPGTGDGYESGTVGVTYAFIACQGEMHIAYSLNEGTATVAGRYRLGGQTYPAAGAPPQPSSIRFAGTVYRGPQSVGSFADGLTGKALGMGCFTGQTQKIANIADVVGPKATPAQITGYFNSLRITVEPANTLRSAAVESSIRGELRRREAEAADAKRKAEEAQRVAARREEEQKAAAERARQQQAASAAAQAGASSVSSAPAARGTHAPSSRSTTMPAAPPPPTREQRIANAIASDKVLADQRLEQQRAAYAQQQAAMAAAEQRQLETMVAVAPAAMELGGMLYGALEGWDARRKARAYQEAQAKQAGRCTLPNGMSAPKDGDIRLGVELTADLSKHDCGHRPTSRYKAFKLELDQTTRLQFAIKAAKWRHLISYQIEVRDMENRSHMFMGWQEWGAFQKVNRKNVELPAGLYIVTVSNGTEDIFAAFDLRVDALGPDWQPLPVAAPAVADTGDVTDGVALAHADTVGDATAPAVPSANYLGLTVESSGDTIAVLAVDPGSPAAAAGLQAGDVVQRIGAQKGLVTADVASFKDQPALDAWLARQKPGARTAVVYRRDGKLKVATLQIGMRD